MSAATRIKPHHFDALADVIEMATPANYHDPDVQAKHERTIDRANEALALLRVIFRMELQP